MKKIAHCIHHTHWDLIWYFTTQDATVQFCYNMKELLEAFKTNKVEHFFFDGQTAPIDEYLMLHPEDESYIKELVSANKLVIGPFNSQLDCYISSGESIINNLRLGIKTASNLGRISNIAYLPDSFGHSYDFPKIFNKFGIKNFIITRGVGDHYHLGSEFYMQSNDDSELLVCTMIAGYGYGCYAFKEGTLFKESALDYNKISVKSLIERLLDYSTIKNEFVFPLGFDQNPAILNIPEKIKQYNKESDEFEFKLTSWEAFCNHVRKYGKNLKIHKNELFSTQYHRVHKSMFSARADIKALQDRCERLLTYELQPVMSMLDALGIPYEHGLIDKAWETLIKCQTHSSATLTDETNNYIERESKNALNLATSSKIYLMKLLSISLEGEFIDSYPLLIFNTLPIKRKMIIETKILTKHKHFKIMNKENSIAFSIKKSSKENCGVLRKNIDNMDESKFYYEHDIVLESDEFNGISYKTYEVINSDDNMDTFIEEQRYIQNNRYKIYQNEDGIVIHDKMLDKKIANAIYLEDSGDEGDSFDYSYPDHDLYIRDFLDSAKVSYTSADEMSIMNINGQMKIPSDLHHRKYEECNQSMEYTLQIILKKDSGLIELKGNIHNHGEQHRVRIIIQGTNKNEYSFAGTQYGYIKRETNPKELQIWKSEKWFEEPSPTFPLLNHVSAVDDNFVVSIFTKSSKEYEFVNMNKKDIAITAFRSYGAMGYPDLNRRPGRPSGLDYMIFETPDCQMKKTNTFEIAITYYTDFNANKITNDYIAYACENTCYQRQDFDKSINPIAYFPTNSWKYKLPQAYNFLSIDTFDGSFGSIVKTDQSNSYLLRLYNNENYEISGGKLALWSNDKECFISDLKEQEIEKTNMDMINFKKGELRIIKIKK
ncbi:mannosylglycerate hydrolase [Breznakia sp. PF5-3]|uniref:glycoside hydrolase family 38 N-terminal domain-containing protein n=1 Tax=unclassified Breznakia TaxID=2623764 RepID=UPI002406F87D|nr:MULTISPECIES: glycoside hydrolase family 38 C-terminal domain-containing protein [unclassified Breznakia]MDF9825790.1 mannosylglycerate hydrolase [Breznakia sp. PM6-1]MDF9836595.1 mannosylglycerate hydrolase [Breznakia sp. PF5-3]MDF9838829.1 mannosylglycerate hydrolase [Breznakia sp. PFB2-8]MDF9860858.1 mannosylglycerate hydrolase [Breznakia sp. PH5-24]